MIMCRKCEKAVAIVAFEGTDDPLCDTCGREVLYQTACTVPSDINEHLPALRELASGCKHVTEFGMRWARGSTVAFLAAQPETLVSWDLDPSCIVSPKVTTLIQLRGKTTFQPRTGNTLKIRTEPTDLLFIDTLHTAKQLLAELERHVDPRTWPMPVAKYLAFHDTESFAHRGEDGSEPGLVAAINHFIAKHAFPHWSVLKRYENNNGLVVLKHTCADGHSPRRIDGRCSWCALPAGAL